MTIPSTSRKAGPFTGNGSTNSWPFTFKVFAATDIKVTAATASGVETELVLGTDYTVSLNANQETSPGGSVTYLLANGSKLTITGDIDYDQTLDLPAGGNFSATALENQLDRTTIQIQQLAEDVARAIKVPVTDTTTPEALLADLSGDAASAAASAASAEQAWETFQAQYYGALAADPALDPLGNAPTAGDLYWNTSLDRMRGYTGAAWADTAVAMAVSVQSFSGTGSQTDFTLSSAPAFQNACEVYIGGVAQVPAVDYTVSGTTLTFTSAPPAGTNNIFVRSLAAYAAGAPSDGSVTPAKLSAGAPTWSPSGGLTVNGALAALGNITAAGTLTLNGNITSNYGGLILSMGTLTVGGGIATIGSSALAPEGSAPSYTARAYISFNGIPLSGTYSRSGTTVTCTVSGGHAMATGETAYLIFGAGTGGTATSGSYQVTVVNATTFTITDSASGTITGTPAVTVATRFYRSANVSSVQDFGVGNYNIVFATPMPTFTYAVAALATGAVSSSVVVSEVSRGTTSYSVILRNTSGTAVDAEVDVAVFH